MKFLQDAFAMQPCFKYCFVINKTYRLPLHPMKLFTFLMAIMVLTLSVMPCADDANAMDNSKAKTELTKSTHRQDSPKVMNVHLFVNVFVAPVSLLIN